MRTMALGRVLVRPNLSTHTGDNLWHQCLQRAYSRTILARDRPDERLLHSFTCRSSSLVSLWPCTKHASPSLQRHPRSYTTVAAVQPVGSMHSISSTPNISSIPRKTAAAIEKLHRPPASGLRKPSPAQATARPPRRTRALMFRLNQSLEQDDVRSALEVYLLLRRRTFPREHLQMWYRLQLRLVQLLHCTRLEMLDGSSQARPIKRFLQLDRHRRTVLKDISLRTLKSSDRAEQMASLVDAIGKSKALVSHSFQTNSGTKLQDWREALRVLEDWAAAKPPWRRECVKNTEEGAAESAAEVNLSAAIPPHQEFQLGNKVLERELATWLPKLMRCLVHSHTFLVRSMLDTIQHQYGIRTTAEMHVVLLDYYALLGRDGCKDTLTVVGKMNDRGIAWKHESAVYDYLLYSLSHSSGNEAEAEKIIQHMLDNGIVPREETMKAAVVCAARSGDMETCSRFIARMHQDWGLTITERIKAILLYACAKRGDFDGALEILGQISASGRLVHLRPGSTMEEHSQDVDRTSPGPASASMAEVEALLDPEDIINNSNILLALINQSHAQRGGRKQLPQEFVKVEVSKVLELFTIITKDPSLVDTQLYTIMMQYLSTLPSPLPAMMYLYREMRGSDGAKPNNVTYRIMLEACAEQMDMDHAKQLWTDLATTGVPKDCFVRASYVKGWGRAGHLKVAEGIALEGLLAQEELDKDQRRHHSAFVARNKKRRVQGLPVLSQLPRRQPTSPMVNLAVLHELMKAHRVHNKPERVCELYGEIEAGRWGRRMRPNGSTLSIVLASCASDSATHALADRGIEFVGRFLQTRRQPEHFKDEQDVTENQNIDLDGLLGGDGLNTNPFLQEDRALPRTVSVSRKTNLPVFSDDNYQLYYTMLGRHHRQRKIVEVWDDMMQSIEQPPSRITVKIVTEALENVQWGAGPIKNIHRQLKERWPSRSWAGAAMGGSAAGTGPGIGRLGGDETVGAGGRFWK